MLADSVRMRSPGWPSASSCARPTPRRGLPAGRSGRSLFFVNGGRIKVSKVTRDGKSLTLAYHGPAELFGDSCLLDGGPRTEMAEAVENALLTEIDRADFEELMHRHPALGLAMTRLMIVRRRELENKVEALVFRDVRASSPSCSSSSPASTASTTRAARWSR